MGEIASVDKQLDLLQGTLDMLILKAVSLGPLHGYGILLRIRQISKDRLEIQDRDYRLEWAEKIGMGFDLPARSSGLRGLLIHFRKVC